MNEKRNNNYLMIFIILNFIIVLPFYALTFPQKIVEYKMDQQIDHNSFKRDVFSQRYYIDKTYAESENSPVIYLIGGEMVCNKKAIKMSSASYYAKKLKAYVVALEHRHYGKSIPYGILDLNSLQYLNTEQALKDLAAAQDYISETQKIKGKWIAFGASYAGNLAAYYRALYPEKVVGAIASSAPVKAKTDFIEYDEIMTEIIGSSCQEDILFFISFLEEEIETEAGFRNITAELKLDKIETPLDLLEFVSTVNSTLFQLGQTGLLCSTFSAKNQLKAFKRLLELTRILLKLMSFNMDIQYLVNASDPNPQIYENFVGSRAWFYQCCTEYAYFYIPSSFDSKRSKSKYNNLNYYQDVCYDLFGISEPVDTVSFNKVYYQSILEAEDANILFINGTNDPWTALGINEEDFNINSSLKLFIIKNGIHASDYQKANIFDSKETKEARNLALDQMKKWLSLL
ncbi:MAG: S28 family serine protease [Pseudomonadota bacterium]